MFKNCLKSFSKENLNSSMFSKRNSTNQNIFYFSKINPNSSNKFTFERNLENSKKKNYEIPRENISYKKNEELKEESEDLRYMCKPLDLINVEDIKSKWQSFFIMQGKVIPDVRRALKNKPNPSYYSFNNDFMETFTDQELIFGLKNIILNEDPSLNYTAEGLFRQLNFRVKNSSLNNNSKINIITLYEFFYHYEMMEHKLRSNDSSVNFLSHIVHSIIPYLLDYQRFFFKDFTYEDNIFILFNMIDKNLIDIFSVKRFLMEYSDNKILTKLEDCKYKLRFFSQEYQMNFSIFFILDRFVKTCKQNNQLDFTNKSKKFKELVHKLILKVK